MKWAVTDKEWMTNRTVSAKLTGKDPRSRWAYKWGNFVRSKLGHFELNVIQ